MKRNLFAISFKELCIAFHEMTEGKKVIKTNEVLATFDWINESVNDHIRRFIYNKDYLTLIL